MVQTKLDKALKAYAKPLLWAFGTMVVVATAYTLTRGSSGGQPDRKGSGNDDWVYNYSASKEFQKSIKPSKSSNLKKKKQNKEEEEEEEKDLDFENWNEEKLRKWLEEVSKIFGEKKETIFDLTNNNNIDLE